MAEPHQQEQRLKANIAVLLKDPDIQIHARKEMPPIDDVHGRLDNKKHVQVKKSVVNTLYERGI